MNCLLPKHGVFISPEGFLTACCVSMHDRFGNVKDEHPIKIYNGEIALKFREDFDSGNLPYSCDQCINQEHYTLRTEKTKAISEVLNEKSKIVYADITLGNICQLNCVMCNETFSHSWAKIKNRPEKIWHVSKEKMFEILELLKGVNYIEIKGGDPFNMPYFRDFLESLYELNPLVNLLFLTSGVYINDSHIEILKQFKNFNIGVSLEANNKLYQYIRGGYHTIDTVFSNLQKCKENNLIMDVFYISSTLSLYNIDSWVEDHINISNRFENLFGFFPKLALNIVLEPKHQSAFLASAYIRKKFYQDLLDSDLKLDKQSFKHILEDRTIETNFQEIIKEIKFYNSIRGMDLLKIKPELINNIDDKYK